MAKLKPLAPAGLTMTMVTNRGAKVWPDAPEGIFCCDQFRARYEADGKPVTHAQLCETLAKYTAANVDFVKTENLYPFDGQPGFINAKAE